MSSFADIVKKANAASKQNTKKKEEDKKTSSFADIVKKANESITSNLTEDEVTKWNNSVSNVSSRAFSYLTTPGYKKADTSLAEEIDKYLTDSASIRGYLIANKNRFKNYEDIYGSFVEQVNYLKDLSKNLKDSNEYFSKFKTEKEYEDHKIGWLNPEAETTQETASARQERYRQNEATIKKLEEDLPWYAATIMPDFMENWFLSDEDEKRKVEYETLKAENNQYKRLQSPLDEYYTPVTPEFTANGAERNYTNASKEDLQKYNATQRHIEALLSDGNHYYDSNGNIINATTKQIDYAADDLTRAMYKDAQDPFSGGFFDTDKSDNATEQYYNSLVQDKLGMFLSASEDDLTTAYSELSSSPTDAKNTWARILQEGDQNAWKQLTEHELNIYYNLYKTQGQAAAYEYLDKMTTKLTQRETLARQKEIDEASGLEQVWLNIKSVPQNVFGGAIGFVEDAANIVRGEDINPYSRAHSFQNDAQYVRQVTAEDINEATGNVALPWVGTTFGDVYQSLMSAADSAVGVAVGGNAYGTLMGMGAASAEMKELWEKGADAGQMVAGGLLAGASEMIFEKYSIDKLVDIGDSKTIKQLIVNGLKQGGVEATEEMFTEIANTITNSIIMGSQSDWVDMETFVKNVVNSGIGGFISGNTMGGVMSAVNYSVNKSKFKQAGTDIIKQGGTDALLNLANEMAGVTGDKTLFKYSDKAAVATQQKAGSKKAALEVGRTSALLQDNITNQNQGEIESALIEKGMSKKDAKRVSEYLASAKDLTEEQIKEVKDNKNIKAVAEELLGDPDSSINERTKKYIAAKLGVEYKASNLSDTATDSGEMAVNTEVDVKDKVSAEGKTIQASTGEAITINKNNAIAKTEIVDGERVVYFNTDKGVVSSNDVSYASEEEGLIYESFVDFNPAFANAVIKNYDGKVPVQTYIKGMREGIVLYGMHNFQGVGKDISKNTFFAELSETDQAFALKLGSAYAESVAKKQGKALRTAIKNAAEKAEANKDTSTKATAKKGRVSFEGGVVAKGKLQKRTVSLAKHLARAIGIDIVFYDSRTTTNPHGEDNNGYYNPYTDTIHLDLQNSASDAKTIAFTLSHELVHFIKKWSPQKFNTFAKFLMEQYAEHGVNTSTLLSNKMAELGTKDADLAYEEMIADACETMLLDSNAVYKLMELRKADLELFEKIKLHIHELLNKIRDMYKKLGLQPTSDEAKALLGMTDVLEQIYSLFEEASVDAAQTYQAAQNANETVFGEASVDVGKTESGVKNQLKNHKKIGEDAMSKAAKEKVEEKYKPSVKKQLKKAADKDYLEAVNRGDMETAQRMVDEAAKANGYPQKLYHGTNKFGFTKIDVSNSDDGISFFATDTEETAETYSSGVKRKRISDASESLPDGNVEEIQDEIKSLTNRLSEWCNRNLGIQGWVDYDYFKSKLEDCFYELEIGTPVDSVISDFDGFCDELYFSFADNYYQGNYEDNPYLDEEDYLSWEDWQESKEANDLSDEYWNNVAQIIAKFKALDTSANSGVYDLYANTEGMLVVDAKGENWNRLPDPRDADGKLGLSGEFNFRMFTTRDYARYGKAEGYRGVIFKNMKDSGDGSYVKPTTVYIFFNPQEQVKSADPVTYDADGNVIPLSQRFDKSNDDIRYQKKRNPSSYAPTFYSQMGKVVEGIKQEKIGAASVVNFLKGKGIKHDEIKWSGIEAFLEGKKSVTKAELQEFIAGSQLQIEEQTTSETIKYTLDQKLRLDDLRNKRDGLWDSIDQYWLGLFGDWLPLEVYSSDNATNFIRNKVRPLEDTETKSAKKLLQLMDDIDAIDIKIDAIVREGKKASPLNRWEDYKLDGGENYRELVFKMPNADYSNKAMRAHWGNDAQGILAHARIQDFIINGKKMLFIEEIQSDWHNEGQKYGYGDNAKALEQARLKQAKLKEEYDSYGKQQDELREKRYREIDDYKYQTEMRKLVEKETAVLNELIRVNTEVDNLEKGRNGSAPDAPFRTNYHEYVLKRLLRMAAEEGYDSIGWTPAQIQSDRWSDEYAEGYRIEYDQDIPKFLKKYGKQWGATVGKTLLPQKTIELSDDWLLAENDDGLIDEAELPEALQNITPEQWVDDWGIEVWSMDITEPMEQAVLYEGQAKFQKKKVSNRTILSNALESAIDTSTQAGQNELKWLKEYQTKIDTIEKEEAHLAEVNAEIKKISFGKNTDRSKLKDLNADKVRTNNRINTYDKQLMRLEAMKPIKDILAREKEMVRKRTEEKGREALANYRREAIKVRNQMIGEARKETRQKISESRSKTEMRHKIKKVVSELNQLLLKGNKDKRVMIGLQKAVAEALDAVNMDTVDADNRVAKYNALIAKAKDPDVIASLTETRDRIQAMGDRMSSKLTSLKNAYGEIKNSTDPLIANSYDEVIASSIEHVVEKVGDTPLRAMSIEQLEDVYDLYTMVLTRIRDANKAFKANKGESISTLSNKVMMEVEKVGGSKTHVLGGKLGAALSLVKKFDFNNLKPVYAFERIGSTTLSQTFENVRKGEDVWAVDITEAKEFKENTASKYNYKKWDFDKVYSFKTSTGNQFSLTLEQIMSLYAYSKREQALPHLAEGGFVFDSNIETHKEKGNGKKSVLKYRVNTATAHKISPFEVADIVGKLTSDQKAFVDEMQKYLSDVMGAKGNEVALEMYGVKLFKEKHYFPLKSAKQYMFEQNDVAGEVKIKNSGFSKGTVKHANNPVILSNFMDVWANHVNDMSMYHAFVLPLEDFNRVFNYNTPASQSLDEESVKGFIQNAYGTQANEYISQLIKDLNGGARIDPRESVSKNMIGKFKKASVFGSASVVIQQPSAIGRALALIGAKYFDFNPKIINHNKLWAEVKKYAPVAIIKEMGHFDTDMGASTVDYIKGEKSLMEKADNIISKPASYMDELTWVHIWTAVKREVKANNKGLLGEAYLQKCGERFTEVVTKTQVYDSVLSRSANMRSKGVFMNMLTSFLAEPTTSINMLEDAITKFSRGQKGKASRQIASVAASVILNAMLVSFVYAARDDDEDETYWEKYIGSLTSEIVDGSNPITYYPILKDIWSIAQGFDVERSDMTLISKAINSLKNVTTVMLTDTEDMTEEELAEHNQKIMDAWLGVAGEFSSLFGIPAKNLIRDIKAGFNVYNTANNGAEGSWSLLWDAVAKSATDAVPIVGWFDTKTKADELYDAIISGDTSVVNRLKSGYKDDKAYNNAIRKALRENDPRIKEAAKARFDGDMTRYKDIAYQIKGEGHFTQDNIVAAIMTEYNALKSATSEESSASKSPEMYNYTDYYNAIINGDDNDIAVVKDYLIESGKTENNIESNLNSKVKEAYEEGELSESEAKALMVSYGGKTEDEADIAIRYVDFKAEYPDYKDVITEARFANYYEPMKDYYGRSVADTGLSISAYAEYCEKSAECKGTDANGDGKTDSGSKKAQVLRVINSLPISSAQKDALYYLNGWAKSKLYSEAPWH